MNTRPFEFKSTRTLLMRSAICGTFTLLSPLSMAAGLIGWWPFNGNLNDGSAGGLNGSALGTPGFNAQIPGGLTGQSVRFDADADGVRIPASAALNAAEFTLGYYINLLGVASGGNGLERLSSRDGFAFETAVGDAHVIGGTSSATGTTLSYYSGSTGWQRTHVALPVTGWTHVAWHNTPSQMQLFINGSVAYTGPGVAAPSGFMNFGNAFNNGEGFDGLMDDAFLWDGSLSAADIAVIASVGIASFAADSDGDGLPNTWETQNGLDPNDSGGINGAGGNQDDDGLTNAQEYANGTKPKDSDTDDDGLNDGPEVTLGTNPLTADTDGDGLADGNEVTLTTNPLLADTDGDFFKDGDEVTAGTDPLSASSSPPIASALVLHLNLEGNTQDSSATANHGSLLGGAAFVNDDSPGGGQAIALTANNMGINVPGSSSLSSNTFTLSYWVKPTTLQEGAGLERLTSRAGDAFETAIGNRAAVGGAPDLTLSYFQGTGWHTTGTQLTLNEWAHVTWRNTGTGPQDMSLFVNGVPVFSGPGVPAAAPGSGFMNIGTRYNDVEGFEGLMDDVRLYGVPLSDSAIASISTPAGLAPLDFVSIVRAPNGASVTLTIQSRPGRTYAVDFSTAMTASGQPGGWVELTDSLVSAGARTEFVDTVASNLPRAFYQVRDITP